MQLPEDASDEDLYRWFIAYLGVHGSAVEMSPGVIRVVVDHSRMREDPELRDDPESADQVVCVHLTRGQLRSAAYEEFDVFDDTDLNVIPRTTTPVWQGLTSFAFYTDEELATMRPGEEHLVFVGAGLRASMVPEPPPVRSARFW